MILEISDLEIRFPMGSRLVGRITGRPHSLEVVSGVSLAVDRGETFGLVGESGSGKTTLGRAVVGLVEPTAGEILVDGRHANSLGAGRWQEIRREVAIVFQDPVASLNPRMEIGALVTEPLAIHRGGAFDRTRTAEKLLDMVGLPARFIERYPHELSGGQARRVAVARALALRPKLIIADEPTAGLDVSVQGDILNLLGRLQREFGISYLVITHNLAVARHVTDRLGIMYLGRLVETGSTPAIFERPAHPYTRALLASQPTGDPDRAPPPPIEGDVPSLWNRPSGCEFHTRCPLATAQCRVEAPPLIDLGGGHMARCHFAGKEE
jgi:peptide/nickel transport system ATP-binding protein